MPRVLIVDDDADVLEVARRAFEHAGYQAVCAGTAEEGLAAARSGCYDVVLMDVQLPGRTGLAAVRELREVAAAPVYLMTGHADVELERDARLLGAAGLLAKPLEFGALARRLKEERA